MKSSVGLNQDVSFAVAPFTGAWIEIKEYIRRKYYHAVAPFTGAWIEIDEELVCKCCGNVAPFTGAWIEIK